MADVVRPVCILNTFPLPEEGLRALAAIPGISIVVGGGDPFDPARAY
jgi:hypothetical protein